MGGIFLKFHLYFGKENIKLKELSCYCKIVQSEVQQLGYFSGKIWIRIEFKKQNVSIKRNDESDNTFLITKNTLHCKGGNAFR